jgi:hypothetical protein
MTTFLAILTGGGLAVIGGLASGWLTNWLGEKRDQRKYEHEQAMAQEARRQERLEQTYIELLRYLSHYADWTRSVDRVLGMPTPAPDPPPREELNRVEALVEAHGSPEVRRLLSKWREHAAKLQYADDSLPLVGLDDEPDADDEAWTRDVGKARVAHRKATLEADQEIRDRIRQELAGEA